MFKDALKENSFTFQSGDIQIENEDLQKVLFDFDLHSNLVIFKLKNFRTVEHNYSLIYIPIW